MERTVGPYDREIADVFHYTGNIIVRYNSLNWAISSYIVRCMDGKDDIIKTNKVYGKRLKDGKPYRFIKFIEHLKQKGELFMPENDLHKRLNEIRKIRNSIGHWLLSQNDDSTWGVLRAEDQTVIDIKSLFSDFMELYRSINEPLADLMQ